MTMTPTAGNWFFAHPILTFLGVIAALSTIETVLKGSSFGSESDAKEQPSKMMKAAADLVERARAGDQNATAMIAQISKSAARGSSKAIIARGMIRDYIKKHPLSKKRNAFGADNASVKSPMDKKVIEKFKTKSSGAETLRGILESTSRENGLIISSTVLALSKPLDNAGVKRIVLQNPYAATLVPVRKCIARAARIQRVSRPNSRIADFSPAIAWELGE
jgi:hypothetical protein